MESKLPRRFVCWMEGQNFDLWLNQNMNMNMKDFAEIGDIMLPSNAVQGDGDSEDKLPNLTPYKVFANKGGTVYKLVDNSAGGSLGGSKSPYGNDTHKKGKEYYLNKDQYQRLIMFPKPPQQPAMG